MIKEVRNTAIKEFRQGNLLFTLEDIPENAIELPQPDPNRIVISIGETGGEHVFETDQVKVWQSDGQTFIQVKGDKPVSLSHTTPRHDHITDLQPGSEYRVTAQREEVAPPRATPPRQPLQPQRGRD